MYILYIMYIKWSVIIHSKVLIWSCQAFISWGYNGISWGYKSEITVGMSLDKIIIRPMGDFYPWPHGLFWPWHFLMI